MKLKDRTVISVGLTGGIASGKSLIAEWLEADGYTLVYADKIGHEVLTSDETIHEIRKSFGEICFVDGCIDRKKLGELVFSDKQKLEELNSITHPRIRRRMQEQMENCIDDRIIIEIPLLFESKLEEHFDAIILVWSDIKHRISRIKQRDSLSENKAVQRIESQTDDSYKIPLSDFVIANNNTINSLREKYYELRTYINCLNDRNALPFYKI